MIYQKLSPRQILVMTWWNRPRFRSYDGVLCDGSIRSGKTLSMAVGFILWSMSRFNGERFAICGKTIESLRRNVIFNLWDWVPPEFSIVEKRSENKLTISAGSRVNTYYLFGGKDESSYSLIQGITLAGALLDEVALMPRSFVEQAIARCSIAGSKFWFNCNPESPAHWFYTEWVRKAAERNVLRMHFTMGDNLSLPPEIRRRYENTYSGVFYQRYIEGLWTKAEGLVYPFFDPGIHMISDQGGPGRYFISCDYGTSNPCVFGLWRLEGSRAVMTREYYYDSRRKLSQKTDEEYYQDLVEFAGSTPIEQIIIDPSAASFRAVIQRHGKFHVRKAKNDVLNGIRVTSGFLKAGQLYFDRSCVHTKAEFQAYAWDERSAVDAVIKDNDHSMDQMRYFAYTVMHREGSAYEH